MTIIKESAPHLRKKVSVSRMMIDVLIALAPTVIFSFVVYPLQTLSHYLISLFIMIASEFVYVGLRGIMPKDDKEHSFKERFIYAYKGKFDKTNVFSAAVSATIFAMIMPAGAPIYAVIIGALAGIVLGKLVFGGLGSNIFNPAAVGMVFAKLCFGSQYQTIVPTWYYIVPDAASSATPLAQLNEGLYGNINNYSIFDMFFGRIPGTLGEVYKVTIIIGLIYLLIRKSVDFRVIVSYLGSFILFALVAGLTVFAKNQDVNPFLFTVYQLFGGGVLFGAVFMLTDPVTCPINAPSRIMYGIITAIFTIFIRLFAALPEGVGFSILIANMVAPVLDHYEWSSSRFTLKKLIITGCLIVVPALIIFFAIYFGSIYHG